MKKLINDENIRSKIIEKKFNKNQTRKIYFLICLNFVYVRNPHEERDYALDLIQNFKDKDIEQILEIFIFIPGKSCLNREFLKKKRYRKDKPIITRNPSTKIMEKALKISSMLKAFRDNFI